jgi:hypothetical protein
LRGLLRKRAQSYMWVVVILSGCGRLSTASVECTFADHRTCTEANTDTIVVRSGTRELARVACTREPFAIANTDRGDVLVIEAQGHLGTPLYRASARATRAHLAVVLRYVGGRDP